MFSIFNFIIICLACFYFFLHRSKVQYFSFQTRLRWTLQPKKLLYNERSKCINKQGLGHGRVSVGHQMASNLKLSLLSLYRYSRQARTGHMDRRANALWAGPFESKGPAQRLKRADTKTQKGRSQFNFYFRLSRISKSPICWFWIINGLKSTCKIKANQPNLISFIVCIQS